MNIFTGKKGRRGTGWGVSDRTKTRGHYVTKSTGKRVGLDKERKVKKQEDGDGKGKF